MKKRYTYTPQDAIWARRIRELFPRCIFCSRLANIQAHHWFKPRGYAPLRLNIYNGVGLCGSCHKRIHKCATGKDYILIAMAVALRHKLRSIEALVCKLEIGE